MRESWRRRATCAVSRVSKAATPRTDFELTDRGRQALERYLAHMEALIRATKGRREK